MNTPIALPPLNKEVYEAIRDTCMDGLLGTPEADELQQLNNLAYDKLKGIVDEETRDKIENLFAETNWLFGVRMFEMGLAIGLEPHNVFKLPEEW